MTASSIIVALADMIRSFTDRTLMQPAAISFAVLFIAAFRLSYIDELSFGTANKKRVQRHRLHGSLLV